MDKVELRNYLNQRVSCQTVISCMAQTGGRSWTQLRSQPLGKSLTRCGRSSSRSLTSYPAKPKGHRRVDLRRVLNGIIFRLRTGCQWNRLPRPFGDDSTVHRHFPRWCSAASSHGSGPAGRRLRALGGVDWPWQAADAVMGKARLGGDLGGPIPPTAAPRGKSSSSGSAGRSPGGHDRGGQRSRHQAARRHARGDRRRASPADGRGPAPQPRQGL